MILGVAGPAYLDASAAECAWVRQQLRVVLQDAARVTATLTIGVGQWAAADAVELGIPLVAVVPFPAFHRRWPPAVQVHYQQLLRRAEKCVLVGQDDARGRHGVRQALLRCNRYVVEHSDALLAVWAGEEMSNTADAVGYARALDRLLHHVDPRGFSFGHHSAERGQPATPRRWDAPADDSDIPF